MSEINDTEEAPEGIFPINLKLIDQYQRKDPILLDKCKMGTYHKGSFRGGSNIHINLIMCEDKIVILSILQSYVLYWYHTYLFHPEMDRMEAMIHQNVYRPGIREAIQKEVTNCNTCQCKKRSKMRYGKLSARESEETPHKKLCVDIIAPHVIRRKGQT